MSMSYQRRLDQQTRSLLDASGLPWSVEAGGRHMRLIVAGHMISVISKSPRVGRKNPALMEIARKRIQKLMTQQGAHR